jgi:deoxyribonuclease (pyrimidine dimer)
MVASGRAVIKNIPNEFSLNSGHVKFFYTRLGYLHRRYKAVHAECIKRGYNVEDYSQSWESVPVSCLGDYTPKPRDREIIINRLIEKRSPSYKKLEFAINPSIKERI